MNNILNVDLQSLNETLSFCDTCMNLNFDILETPVNGFLSLAVEIGADEGVTYNSELNIEYSLKSELENLKTNISLLIDNVNSAGQRVSSELNTNMYSVDGTNLLNNICKQYPDFALTHMSASENTNIYTLSDSQMQSYLEFARTSLDNKTNLRSEAGGEWCKYFVNKCLKNILTEKEKNDGQNIFNLLGFSDNLSTTQSKNDMIGNILLHDVSKEKEYIPEVGDVIFVNHDSYSDGLDHTALINSVVRDENGSVVSFESIEGNMGDTMKSFTYELGNDGYFYRTQNMSGKAPSRVDYYFNLAGNNSYHKEN